LVVAALRGGAGKTILSVGIIAALRRRGHTIAPFKKGPDYIDTGWLAIAAGRPCYNLDTFLIDPDAILQSYRCGVRDAHMAVIEGNRGLYDSIGREVHTSTAELAKSLGLPVVLCLDATKTTRTMAAVVKGCQVFDPAVKLKGVILNRVAGARHRDNLTGCIEHYCNVPVLGAIPKLSAQHFPERHMGLVPTPEHGWAVAAVEAIADEVDRFVDVDRLHAIAVAAAPQQPTAAVHETKCFGGNEPHTSRPRVGILRDAAFQFYYPENIEALGAAGAQVVFTSPLTEKRPPPVDALYIGGGFPETHAQQLAGNKTYRDCIRSLAQAGLPIYAECGGLMYLGDKLRLKGVDYEMTGVLPLVFGFNVRPQGHGYTILNVTGDNPFFDVGTTIKGHEFHYSSVIEFRGQADDAAFTVQRGKGLFADRDGLMYKNVLATYTHIHALGTPQWAGALVRCARRYQRQGLR